MFKAFLNNLTIKIKFLNHNPEANYINHCGLSKAHFGLPISVLSGRVNNSSSEDRRVP